MLSVYSTKQLWNKFNATFDCLSYLLIIICLWTREKEIFADIIPRDIINVSSARQFASCEETSLFILQIVYRSFKIVLLLINCALQVIDHCWTDRNCEVSPQAPKHCRDFFVGAVYLCDRFMQRKTAKGAVSHFGLCDIIWQNQASVFPCIQICQHKHSLSLLNKHSPTMWNINVWKNI